MFDVFGVVVTHSSNVGEISRKLGIHWHVPGLILYGTGDAMGAQQRENLGLYPVFMAKLDGESEFWRGLDVPVRDHGRLGIK